MTRHLLNAVERAAERENQRIGMRTSLEVLISFDLIITTSIMQRDNVSISVSVYRHDHKGSTFDLPVI